MMAFPAAATGTGTIIGVQGLVELLWCLDRMADGVCSLLLWRGLGQELVTRV
jgi:hypothetical protein